MNVIEAHGLSKRYGRTWALRDLSIAIPAGRVTALVGPNGAGKTTLLHVAVGLTTPTKGSVAVLGGCRPGDPGALADIAFVAQDAPLYRNLSVADTIRLAESMNDRFDAAAARKRIADLDIPPRRRIGKLSGGQHTQVALAVTLARRPKLVILDEPVASLDPLARHDVMAALMAVVAEEGLSVVLSSHVVAELERVCDYLVILAAGGVQVAGNVDDLLAEHHVLTGTPTAAEALARGLAVARRWQTDRQATLLVRGPLPPHLPPGLQIAPTNMQELVLAYLREPQLKALPGPHGTDERISA
ncbi:ABC transporter ATP-binding protein [uncultured Jatrophihabitans sp.]|uniref:ABC transporter ATP-binding protein n=1 Tax=uncultured Jatrophihabitans sp. TaxID=1610747 RepID=UPI0035C9ADA4